MGRKRRSDKGKKRKRYGGKPVKRYNRIRFNNPKGRKTHIKLRVFEKRKMSREGRLRWNAKARKFIRPYTQHMGQVFIVPVEEISTRENCETWSLENIGYVGDFLLMSVSGSLRSKRGVKWVKCFRVRITEHPNGLHANMYKNERLFRYFFWQKR